MEHPTLCYSLLVERKDTDNVEHGKLIVLKWGESGYFETPFTNDYTQKDVEEFNRHLNVSHNEAEAMSILSMNDKITTSEWDEKYPSLIETLESKQN